MLNLMIAVCATFGGAYSTEIPVNWASVLRIIRHTETQRLEYYKTGRPPAAIGEGSSSPRIQFVPLLSAPNMNWAVPNSMLPGGPPFPVLPFPDYGPYLPGSTTPSEKHS